MCIICYESCRLCLAYLSLTAILGGVIIPHFTDEETPLSGGQLSPRRWDGVMGRITSRLSSVSRSKNWRGAKRLT